MPSGFKRCPRCEHAKPVEDFPRNRSARDTRLYGSTRQYHLIRRYGISGAEFDALVAGQGNRWAICGISDPQHVDHDHVTGAVRGVLCFNCNGGLGQFRDDVQVLAAAINYLEGAACPTQLREQAISRLRFSFQARPLSSIS